MNMKPIRQRAALVLLAVAAGCGPLAKDSGCAKSPADTLLRRAMTQIRDCGITPELNGALVVAADRPEMLGLDIRPLQQDGDKPRWQGTGTDVKGIDGKTCTVWTGWDIGCTN